MREDKETVGKARVCVHMDATAMRMRPSAVQPTLPLAHLAGLWQNISPAYYIGVVIGPSSVPYQLPRLFKTENIFICLSILKSVRPSRYND
jgi:hypothetical protein